MGRRRMVNPRGFSALTSFFIDFLILLFGQKFFSVLQVMIYNPRFPFISAKTHDPHRRNEPRQMQTQKMQPDVHKILPHGSQPNRSHPIRRKQNRYI